MAELVVDTCIDAPPELCFDMARDIGLHCRTASGTQEKAVAGVTEGLIGLGQSVTFQGTHLGVRQRLTSKVVEFERPVRFADQMQRGAFKSMRHIHEFELRGAGTLMRDTLIWVSPLGMLGRIVDALLVKPHLRRFLIERNAQLKAIAEAGISAPQET